MPEEWTPLKWKCCFSTSGYLLPQHLRIEDTSRAGLGLNVCTLELHNVRSCRYPGKLTQVRDTVRAGLWFQNWFCEGPQLSFWVELVSAFNSFCHPVLAAVAATSDQRTREGFKTGSLQQTWSALKPLKHSELFFSVHLYHHEQTEAKGFLLIPVGVYSYGSLFYRLLGNFFVSLVFSPFMHSVLSDIILLPFCSLF